MVITYFYIIVVSVFFTETDPVLIVNANTVLPLPIPMQRFKSIVGWYPQIVQVLGIIDHHQLSERYFLNGGVKFARKMLMKDPFCLVICKCFDHAHSIHAKQVYVNTQIGADTLGDERQEAPAHSPEGTGG